MRDPDLLLAWVRGATVLAGVAALVVGALSAASPARSIRLYQWIMARCNWRVEPIDAAREARNTRVLGALLVLLSLVLCVAATRTWAEDVSVQVAVSRRHIPLNGRLQLTVQVNGAQEVQPPDVRVEGFEARYVGPSTQISIVNGQMFSAVAHTYLLSPQQEGHFIIGPIPVTVGGTTYHTQPIEVDVGPALASPEGVPGEAPAGKTLQLQLGTDARRVYLHQEIPIRLQLLVGGVAVRGIKMPTVQAEGFVVRPRGSPRRSDVEADGQPYTLVEFDATVAPVRGGTLTLGPARLDCQLIQPHAPETFGGGSLFDEFLGQARLVPVTVRAEPVTIDVLPLPSEGQPAHFSGAVGRFELAVDAVPTTVAADEPVTITMTVRGAGAPDFLQPPTLAGDLSGWLVHEPRVVDVAAADSAGTRKVFEQQLVPRASSVRQIPSVTFSYFDPSLEQYRTLTQGPWPLTVTAPSTPARNAPVADTARHPTPAIRAPVTPTPARPHTLTEPLAGASRVLPGGTRAWAGAALALILGLRLIWRQRASILGGSRAMAPLSRARQLLVSGKPSEGCGELLHALQRYLGERLRLPTEQLTALGAEAALRSRAVPDELVREVVDVWHQCETARLAPASVALEQAQAAWQATAALLRRLDAWRARP